MMSTATSQTVCHIVVRRGQRELGLHLAVDLANLRYPRRMPGGSCRKARLARM
jgi:hypothetical protein